jgi:hypothetical protein
MNSSRLALCLTLFLLALDADGAVTRRNVILGVGEEVVHMTGVSIATVTTPPGTASEAVRFAAEQYGNAVRLRGIKKGDAKLLVESTAARIEEVVHVTVMEKGAAERARQIVTTFANAEGIGRDSVHVASDIVMISGTAFSPADHARCRNAESTASKKSPVTVVCAARMNSAAFVVDGGTDYVPIASVAMREETTAASGEVPAGSEGASRWVAELRFGDVPFAELASNDHSALLRKSGAVVAKLRKASEEWKKAADTQNRIYPVLVHSRRTTSGYELAMQWRLDQGTRGDSIAEFSFDDLQHAVNTAGTAPDRVVEWWAGLLQDAFRLYHLGGLPLRTGASPALTSIYRSALSLENTPLGRSNAALRVARSFTATRWSSGADPLERLATAVPASFEQRPVTTTGTP